MCDPVTLLGLALGVGGSVAGIVQARNAQAAQQDTLDYQQQMANWNRKRQAQWAAEQDAAIKAALAKVSPDAYAQEQAATAAQRAESFQPTAAGTGGDAIDPFTLYASQEVSDPATKAKLAGNLAEASAAAKKRVAALAALSSWGSTTEGAARALKALGTDVSAINTLRTGANRATTGIMDLAGRYAMPTTSDIGQVLQAGGSLLMRGNVGTPGNTLGDVFNDWGGTDFFTTNLFTGKPMVTTAAPAFNAADYLRQQGIS